MKVTRNQLSLTSSICKLIEFKEKFTRKPNNLGFLRCLQICPCTSFRDVGEPGGDGNVTTEGNQAVMERPLSAAIGRHRASSAAAAAPPDPAPGSGERRRLTTGEVGLHLFLSSIFIYSVLKKKLLTGGAHTNAHFPHFFPSFQVEPGETFLGEIDEGGDR